MAGQILVQRGAGSVGGGSGTPGGSNTQVQYNDGGAFGGDAGLVFDEATDLLTADHVLLAQGTITDPEPNLEGTVTWNDGADIFTAWKLNVTNTNSHAESLLLDLQVGASSVFSVRRDGRVQLPGAQLVQMWNDSGNFNLRINDGQKISFGNQSAVPFASFQTNGGNGRLAFHILEDTTLERNGTAGQLLFTDKLIVKESSANPSAADLTSGANAKDRLGWYMKADKLVFAYNNAGTVTYVTLDLDGSDTTWAHNTTAP